MDKWLKKSNKTWLISLALLIGLFGVSASSSSISVNHSKQTEVTVRPSCIKAVNLFSFTCSNHFTYYAGDLCYATRVNIHSQHAALKVKSGKSKTVSRSSALGHSHLKKLNSKEDVVLPKS